MGRTLQVATLLFACAAGAPACLLDGGAFDATGTGGTGLTVTTNSGGAGGDTGGTNAGGTGGTAAVCGDGKSTGAEKCDDGDTDPGDGCGPDCQVEDGYACSGEPSVCADTCGDGAIEPNLEECDDDNMQDGDGCSDCQIDDGHLCAGAPSMCPEACGNGVVDVNDQNDETCDDKNGSDTDGCIGCVAQTGWECNGMPSMCLPTCGDSMVVGPEPCDDGPNGGCKDDCTGPNPGYTCSQAGVCMPDCGDGLIVAGEECEDGNAKSGDGCSSTCQVEATCNNGIIEPGELCDDENAGGGDCESDCKVIDATKTCGKAVPLPMGAPNGGGVMITMVEGDTMVDPPSTGDVLDPTCSIVKKPKLYLYTTGDTGSIVTLETKAGMVAGVPTFMDTVVWAYRDCLGKRGEELCNDDIVNGVNLKSKGTTGYLPPKTALFIVVAGSSDVQEGKFLLEIREQPVRLLFGQTFTKNIAGLTVVDFGGDGNTWSFCDAVSCSPNATLSVSGTGHALAYDNNLGNLNGETLQVGGLPVAPLQTVMVQYNYYFNEKGGGDADSLTCTAAVDGGGTWSTLSNAAGGDSAGRMIHNVSSATASARTYAVRFTYTDDGDGDWAEVDDFFVYGY